MSNIDKIRQEIERNRQAIRVLNEHTAPEQMSKTCAIFQYSDSILSGLNSFIDSLPEERPSKDLEEAANEYAILDEEGKWKDGGKYKGFIAGAEWMRKKDVEDMYMSDNRHFLKCYEQGKVDMKVQLMKDAVEGEIQMRYSGCLCAKTIRAINEDKFKLGDKVRIIIVKED